MASDNIGSRDRDTFRRLSGVPVFVYHGLLTAGSSAPEGLSARSRKYWIAADQFREELTAIVRNGGVIGSLGDLCSNNRELSSNLPAVLTFDDGYASDYEIAFPLLLEAGVRAHFFINTATVGSRGRLSWPQVREMHACGMFIDSHAHDHCYLTHCSLDEMRRQLALSKRMIEDRLGAEAGFLAAPYGDFNGSVVRVVREAGYRALCTGRSWPARWARDIIDRTIIHDRTGLLEFQRLFSRDVFGYGRRAARAAMISMPKKVWLQLRFRGWQPAGEEAVS